mmetsp:Transcript_6102/g.18300  ORF Transcript_6102/g.18300 Transcript_6102/m.18300 type:complete len:118 (+) Transcript_6102:52-405(+)
MLQVCTPDCFDQVERAVKCSIGTRPSQYHYKHTLQLGTVPAGWNRACAVLTLALGGVVYETSNAGVDYPKLRAQERQRHNKKEGGRDAKRGSGGGGGRHRSRGGRGRQQGGAAEGGQ